MNHLNLCVDIREATPDDWGGVLACLADAFEPYRDQYTLDAFRDTIVGEEGIELRMAEMTVLVVAMGPRANECKNVVATIAFAANPQRPSEGHVRGMAVLSDLQIGPIHFAQELLQRAEKALKEAGCTRVTLDTTEPLKRAQRFYEKHGYAPSGRESDFYGMRLIELEKRL